MTYLNYQLLNLVRHTEQSNAPELIEEVHDFAMPIEAELRNQDLGFTEKATQRALQLADVTGLRRAFEKFSSRSKSLLLLGLLLMALLGFYAVLQTLSSDSLQLNIYWLLLVLLGVNTISLLLWLGLIIRTTVFSKFAVRSSLVPSPLVLGYQKLLQTVSLGSRAKVLFSSWSETHLLGQTGRWYSSKVIHSAWLMYLAGGLAALLITLSGKQYDFVWGTTLLSSQNFIGLTESLAALPAKLGFAYPSTAQIIASNQGASVDHIDQVELRAVWANFLLGCILIYAVVPRLMLWVLSIFLLDRAQRQYQPDWDLPYFYQLRARLLPESSSLGIVDADTEADSAAQPQLGQHQASDKLLEFADLALPAKAMYAAFEWGHRALPKTPLTAANQGQEQAEIAVINDAQAQHELLKNIASNNAPTAIFVPLERAADRGAARFLQAVAERTELHLIVVRTEANASDPARWAGWQALGERIKLVPARVVLVNNQ